MSGSSAGPQTRCSPGPGSAGGPQTRWSPVPGDDSRVPSLSRMSSQRSSYEERCVDPPEDALQDDGTQSRTARSVHKAHPKDANGQGSETIGFIPGTAEPAGSGPPQTCGPCGATGACRSLVSSVYRVCQRTILAPCLAPAGDHTSPDEAEKISLRAGSNPGPNGSNPGPNGEDDTGDCLDDLHIGGVKVDAHRQDLIVSNDVRPYQAPPGGLRVTSPSSFYDSMAYDDEWDDGGEGVDSLIAKKLLELYSEYQIQELARCTSDSVFLKKTSHISQLITSLAEEHQLDQQEAECRLVRGIIRISTRKSKKRRPAAPPGGGPPPRSERTLSDSGNETMRDSDSVSFSNNNDYKSNPNIQISEQTNSDAFARRMRNYEDSPSQAEAQSSGVPLTHSPVRT